MVLKMEQGGLLQHQLPLHNDYGFPSEPDCADHCGSTGQHDGYSNGHGLEMMRRDSAINHHIPATFTYQPSQATAGARFVNDRGVGDLPQSGSISTSPSSAASSLAYTSYPGAHYTSVQHLPGPVQLPFVPSTFAEARPSTILDTHTHQMLPPPRTINNLPQPIDAKDVFSVNSTPIFNRAQLSTPAYSAGSYPYADTPRSLLSSTSALSLSPGTPAYSNAQMAASSNGQNFTPSQNDCAGFPWSDLESVNDMTCDGQLLVPKIIATVEKGFFADKKTWTCYRRNYFSVTCGFELHPNVVNGRVTIRYGNSMERVQAMGMRLSAAIDGPDGKTIELIQHTPKRDLGPKTKVDIVKVAPKPLSARPEQNSGLYQVPVGSYHGSNTQTGPYLPLQYSAEPDAQAGASQASQASAHYAFNSQAQATVMTGQSTEHTFERVQFKQATANNGKRRATQQFFHLIVELFADIRKDGSDQAVWVKVAQRVSDKIVVRGRSPSHYQNEKPESGSMTGGLMQSSGGSSGYNTLVGSTYASLNAGAFRSVPSTYIAANGAGLRKGEFHSDHGSQSDSSSSSLEEHGIDTTYANDTVMSDADRVAFHEHDGYQYYPSAMYEHVQSTLLPPITKLNNDGSFMNDSKMYAVKAEYADAVPGAQYPGTCGRFQGVDTSRGYFPDLQRF